MDWWLVILLAVVVLAGTIALRMRGKQRAAMNNRPVSGTGDFSGDRETNRVSRLSDEDRAWETASLQRSQDAAARDKDVAGPA